MFWRKRKPVSVYRALCSIINDPMADGEKLYERIYNHMQRYGQKYSEFPADDLIDVIRSTRDWLEEIFLPISPEEFEEIVISGFLSGRKGGTWKKWIDSTREEVESLLFLPDDLREQR